MKRKIIGLLLLMLTFLGCYNSSSSLFTVYDDNENNDFGVLRGITIDADDNLYVIGEDGSQIIQIEGNGKHSVVYDAREQGQMNDIVMDHEGNFYTTESSGHVMIIGSDGMLIREWYVDSREVQMFDLDIDSNNNIYITDTRNNRILKYSTDGIFIKEYIDEYYMQQNPMGIYIDDNDNIYYGFVVEEGMLVKVDQNDIYKPLLCTLNAKNICMDKYDNLYLSDGLRIAKYSEDFQLLELWNIDDESIFPKGEYTHIIDIAVNSRGRIFVIRDNKILVCDKYYKGTDAAWIIWAGVVTALLAGGVAAVLVRRRRKAGAE